MLSSSTTNEIIYDLLIIGPIERADEIAICEVYARGFKYPDGNEVEIPLIRHPADINFLKEELQDTATASNDGVNDCVKAASDWWTISTYNSATLSISYEQRFIITSVHITLGSTTEAKSYDIDVSISSDLQLDPLTGSVASSLGTNDFAQVERTITVSNAVIEQQKARVASREQEAAMYEDSDCGFPGSLTTTAQILLTFKLSSPCACQDACNDNRMCTHWTFSRNPMNGDYRSCELGTSVIAIGELTNDRQPLDYITGEKNKQAKRTDYVTRIRIESPASIHITEINIKDKFG